MNYSREDLAKYRIERAFESIEEARVLARDGHWNTVANRLYYSCFYGASAFLVKNGHESSTHNGIKASFNKELIRSAVIDESFGLLYNKLFNLRQDADYRDFKDLTETDIRPMIPQVERLLLNLKRIMWE